MTHTPGPWRYVDRPDGCFGVEIDGGHELLYDLEGSCPQCFANMRLIAAGPELIEACKCGHGASDGWLWDILTILQSNDHDLAELFRRKMQLEVAAIAKAEQLQ